MSGYLPSTSRDIRDVRGDPPQFVYLVYRNIHAATHRLPGPSGMVPGGFYWDVGSLALHTTTIVLRARDEHRARQEVNSVVQAYMTIAGGVFMQQFHGGNEVRFFTGHQGLRTEYLGEVYIAGPFLLK